MRTLESTPTPVAEHRTDGPLLAEVLRVYKPHCRYLRSAAVTTDGELPQARCEFVIPESCYIDDTGHFNSVEFNICYNQMLYYLVAKSVKERLVPALADWTMDDFWTRQLGDIYIAGYESVFQRPMRGRELFHGEIELHRVKRRGAVPGRQPLIWLETTCRYWEDGGGHCAGQIRIAITNPPATAPSTGDRGVQEWAPVRD